MAVRTRSLKDNEKQELIGAVRERVGTLSASVSRLEDDDPIRPFALETRDRLGDLLDDLTKADRVSLVFEQPSDDS